MFYKGKKVVVHTQTSNLAFVSYEDNLENTFNVPRDKLTEKSSSTIKPFDPDSEFLIEHTMLRHIPIVFDRIIEYKDLSGKTTSHSRSEEKINLGALSRAESFVRGNPEFVELCRLGVRTWGKVSLQWAAEAYRWPLEAFDLPLKKLKETATARKKAEYDQAFVESL